MSNKKRLSVHTFAPASVANVGCGFDVLGFAIDGPGDEVIATRVPEPGVSIQSITGDDHKLPLEPIKNTAGRGVLSLLEALGEKADSGVQLDIIKKMPLGSGLGSSAASSVAAVVAVNHLFGEPFKRSELLPFVIEGELAASGSPHADNVSASLLGGFILVRSNHPLDVITLESPDNLFCTIIHPKIEIPTKNTRLILRKEVPLSKAVSQWGNVGALVAGLYSKDLELIGRSMQDEIVEPTRSFLIPGFDEMKQASKQAGALGFSISGAGPSVFALSGSEKVAQQIADKAGAVMTSLKLDFDTYISCVNKVGSRILDETFES